MVDVVEVFFYDGITYRKKKRKYGYVIRYNGKKKAKYIKARYKTTNRMQLFCFYRAIRGGLKKGRNLRIYTDNKFIFNCFAKNLLSRWIENNFMTCDGMRQIYNQDIWIKICYEIGLNQNCICYFTHKKINLDQNLENQLAYINANSPRAQIFIDI